MTAKSDNRLLRKRQSPSVLTDISMDEEEKVSAEMLVLQCSVKDGLRLCHSRCKNEF